VYDVQSVGVVSSPHDSTQRPDTVVTHSVVSYDAHWQGALFGIFGQVAYRITATPGVQGPTTAARAASPRGSITAPGTPSSAQLPATSAATSDTVPVEADRVSFEFNVDTATGAIHRPSDSAAVPGCPAGGPAVEQDEALASDRPRSFAVGTEWSDTLTHVSCLVGIPVTSRTTRVFHVVSASTPDPVSGAPSVEITYQSDVIWDGEARRHADLVTLHATGSGTTEQYYDRATGVLLSAQTDVAFDLTAAINGRSQYLHQVAQWRAQVRGKA
jgi:hypothetical protein